MSSLELCLLAYCILVSVVALDLLIKNHDLRKTIEKLREKGFGN